MSVIHDISLRTSYLHRLRKRAYFRKLLLTLALSAALPVVIVALLTYRNYTNRLIDEISVGNRRVLEQIGESIDNVLYHMEGIAWNVATDRDVRYYADHHYTDDVVRFNRLRERLSTQKGMRDFIRSIEIYYEKFEYSLSVRADGANGLYHIGTSRTEPWLDRYTTGTRYDIFMVSPDTQRLNPYLCLIYPLLNRSFSEAGGVVIVTVNSDSFYRIIAERWTKQLGTGLVMHKDGTPLFRFGTNPERENGQPVFEVVGGNNADTPVGYSGTNVVSTVTSTKSDWIISSSVSRKKLMRDIQIQQRMILMIVAGTIVGALLFTLLIGRQLYQPLRVLLSKVARAMSTTGLGHDEFAAVGICLDTLTRERNELEYFVKTNTDLLRDKVMADIMNGAIDPSELPQDTLARLHLRLPDAVCAILLVRLDVVDPVTESLNFDAPAKHTGLARIARNLLAQLKMPTLAFQVTYSETAVIFDIAACGDPRKTITLFAKSLDDLACRQIHHGTHLSVGTTTTVAKGLKASYRTAVKAMGQHLIIGDAKVVFADDVLDHNENRLNVERYAGKISDSLRSLNWEGIQLTLTQIVSDIGDTPGVSLIRVQNFLFQLISHTMWEIERINSLAYRELGDMNVYGDLLTLPSLPVIGQRLEAFFKDTFTCIERNRTTVPDCPGAVAARRIVDESFNDNQISLSTISEKVGLTPAYLSSVFKQHAGIGFHEYLNQIRIQRGKSLLETTHLPVYRIAREVGYVSKHSFIRQFKKIVGHSPGRYRNRTVVESNLHNGSPSETTESTLETGDVKGNV
jgi:two-component system, response regulator YesN